MNSFSFQAATVQFEPRQFEKERNISRLCELVEEAARNGARLIVTPEMGTTGYCWYDRAEVAPFVEPVPGPTTDRFAGLAARCDCYIVIGMPEVDPVTNVYYNTAVLIGPEGVVGKHRKTHPYISEPKWAASGDRHDVFDTPIGRIALLVCMDIHYIETARLAALQGADVICHISNWLDERTPAPYWITRAFENGCYVIESNRWGWERTVQFSGGSCIIDPDGSVQVAIDEGDGIAYGTIDPERARNKRAGEGDRLADRRPELYQQLLLDSYLWNPLDFFGLYGKSPLPPGRASRIAVVQCESSDDVQANLQTMETYLAEAAGRQAELVVFPELSVSGPYAGQGGEPVPGPSTEALIALSIRYRTYIVAGLVESDGDRLYNTAVLTGPEGLVGTYRQIHVSGKDRAWASAGSDWAVFDLPVGRVGLLIGRDALFPEAGRVLALLGCDLIVCPSMAREPVPQGHAGTGIRHNYPIPTGADPHHWHLHRARAGENNVYWAFANPESPQAGLFGKSGIFGPETFRFPRREAIVPAGSGIAVLDIDTSNLDTPYPTNPVRRKDLVLMRQPTLYYGLIADGGMGR
ncbi:nitrilase-related carbon-nitrogen hydrolase [Paenibacillus ginsengihumi]|uniref:nitrilase-related carbon-nitrogen hydrolase n=1 Tax=Paenibacillus ginsengihumi TaxID=431596 RepID=UPI000376CFF9|nr:nitrilase-related carbon-nitrogen hydrolase [Paenibacillus ginsengihumi]